MENIFHFLWTVLCPHLALGGHSKALNLNFSSEDQALAGYDNIHLVHAALHAVVPGQVLPGLVLGGLFVPARHVPGQRAVVTRGQRVHCNNIKLYIL